MIPKVQELLEEYEYKPTVRGIFYRPNTFKEYKGLIQALSTARKKNVGETGYIDPFVFADDSRYIEDIEDRFVSQQDYVDDLVDQLKNAHENYFEDGYLPSWYRQPYYIEVMIEKEALRGAFKSVLPENYVRIVPNKGWDSITYRQKNIQRLYKWRKGVSNDISKEVTVLYFGDYDPTGCAMSYNIEESLKPYGINFVRIALNHEHIENYGLEHLRNPDPDVARKLGQDPNRHHFMEENNGELFQIELDALQKSPQQFKDLVVDAVDSYYDESIHEKNLKEFTPRKITALVNKRVKFLKSTTHC